MREVRRAQGHQQPATDKRRGRKDVPTVASLGVQATLIPINADQQHEIADLIGSYEMLRAEWERLFQRVIDLLNDDDPRTRGGDGRSPPSDL